MTRADDLPAFREPDSPKRTTPVDPDAMFTVTADGEVFQSPQLFDVENV